MIFKRPGGALLKVDEAVVLQLDGFVQRRARDAEACGVLLGRYLDVEPHVIVDKLTGPCSADQRTRTRAHRSRQYHQQRVDAAWRESGGTCVYLGEWHSHAEPDPTPSAVDLADWRRRMTEDRIGGERFFFIIVGQERLRLWEGEPATGSISECGLRRRTER